MTELYFFSLEILEMMFHMKRLACGSTPVDGSSKKIIGGLPIIAMETLSFLLLPPDRFYAWMSAYSMIPMSSMSLWIIGSLKFLSIPFSEA